MILERLSIMDTCEVIAMIACTRSELLTELELVAAPVADCEP